MVVFCTTLLLRPCARAASPIAGSLHALLARRWVGGSSAHTRQAACVCDDGCRILPSFFAASSHSSLVSSIAHHPPHTTAPTCQVTCGCGCVIKFDMGAHPQGTTTPRITTSSGSFVSLFAKTCSCVFGVCVWCHFPFFRRSPSSTPARDLFISDGHHPNSTFHHSSKPFSCLYSSPRIPLTLFFCRCRQSQREQQAVIMRHSAPPPRVAAWHRSCCWALPRARSWAASGCAAVAGR